MRRSERVTGEGNSCRCWGTRNEREGRGERVGGERELWERSNEFLSRTTSSRASTAPRHIPAPAFL